MSEIIPKPPHPYEVRLVARGIARRFTLTLHDDGSFFSWTGSIVHGVCHVGESGSSVFRSSTRAACVRKMMRVVAKIAAAEGYEEFAVTVEKR